ncbi:MAG TPA: hypothetical protein VF120_17115 [Ktedonobacterales bacterium]
MTTGDEHDQRADTNRATTRNTTEERLAEHKRLVCQVLETVGNDRNLTRIQDDIGFNNAIGRIRWLFIALPDVRITIDWQVAEGDQVVNGKIMHHEVLMDLLAALEQVGARLTLHHPA